MRTKPQIISKVLALLVLTLIITQSNVFAQRSDQLQIKWNEPTLINYKGTEIYTPSIEGQHLDGNRPNFFYKRAVSYSSVSPELAEIVTEPASKKEVMYLRDQKIQVPKEPSYDLKITNDRNKSYVVLNLFPFVVSNGVIHRISNLLIKYVPKPSAGAYQAGAYQKDFVTSSVLAVGSGDWYKISVTQDGIYKIDKQFLENLGIDIENIDPSSINIYGNGDGLLPELNSAPRTDDLAKNAITIVGESDGSFDNDDYILFYGWGPHRWYQSDSTFYRTTHIYSDVSCYFININPSEAPLRINDVMSTTDPVTHTVSDYNYFEQHEIDAVSLVNGGQRWYGELFDTQLTRTVSFTVPDVVSGSPAIFRTAIASNAKILGGTQQVYSVNSTVIYTDSLPTASEYGRSSAIMQYNNPGSIIPLTISITRNSPDVLTYLDFVQLNCRRSIKFNNSEFSFRDVPSVGIGNVTEFTVIDYPATNGFIWEVTDRHQPKVVKGNTSGSDYVFTLNTDNLRTFVVSDGVAFKTPQRIGPVDHQNLHALPQADYLIVTNKLFKGQADRLASLHQNAGTSTHVVTTEQIFNEYSSGMQDATAIRTFAKMFWDRGELTPSTRPKHLLLFGDGTYDPKNRVPNNNNYVLTYQVLNSENHIAAMPSDDYFGILDSTESMSSADQVDIGVGRLLVSDNTMAKEQVDKIQHYMMNGSSLYNNTTTNCCCGEDGSSTTFGDWRTKYVQVADDEEGNYFIDVDTEPQSAYVKDSFPEMNCIKIYTDAYQQVTTAGGERYPEVNEAITKMIERGVLVWNYVGHGGEVGLAEERILTVPMIQDWKNIDVMPLMVSSTCEFTKFDDPDRVSAGEWASINPYGAAIALMTTTRSVYFGTNTMIGNQFYRNVFKRDANFEGLTFGEIIRLTKNAVGGDNKRSFTLIGDPALQLALPKLNIVTDSINGVDPDITIDTIWALSKVTVKGHIEDWNSNVQNSFNGVLMPSVYDKPKVQQTLSNDGPVASPETTFKTQTNKVYAGKATIANGYFEFSFVVPKDIDYAIDFGKISYYAENGQTDAIGYDTMFYIGGIDPNGINDNTGPEIDLFLNDESFVNGGITDETPILLAKLFDENGINTVGNGIGHDLVAILDNETSKPIVLNDFYIADLDSYQSGEIRYPFSELEPGNHTLTIKVWDVNNNSSEASIDFVVQEEEEMALDHVLNYPNPFTTSTEFYFEHNQVCDQLEVQIQIFTISGRLVKTINRYVLTEGFRSEGIEWDGRDEFGDQLAKGVYVYRLIAKTADGKEGEHLEKLVILK